MFGHILNNPALTRRLSEDKPKGDSYLKVFPFAFQGPGEFEIRLVSDPKLPLGYHQYTMHYVSMTQEEEKSESILCSESQPGKEDMPCACCMWTRAFGDDEVDADGRMVKKSMRTRLKQYAEKNIKYAAEIEELIDAADQMSFYKNRQILMPGIVLDAIHTKTKKQDAKDADD